MSPFTPSAEIAQALATPRSRLTLASTRRLASPSLTKLLPLPWCRPRQRHHPGRDTRGPTCPRHPPGATRISLESREPGATPTSARRRRLVLWWPIVVCHTTSACLTPNLTVLVTNPVVGRALVYSSDSLNLRRNVAARRPSPVCRSLQRQSALPVSSLGLVSQSARDTQIEESPPEEASSSASKVALQWNLLRYPSSQFRLPPRSRPRARLRARSRCSLQLKPRCSPRSSLLL